MERQTTSSILMIRPTGFGYNVETAADNPFQRCDGDMEAPAIQEHAQAEFDGFVDVLRQNDLEIITVEDTPDHITPDSLFPNNWISFHQDGSVILYPMMAPNRRLERRPGIVRKLVHEHNFAVGLMVDLSLNEYRNRFLEGTGSMVFDRSRRKIYACISKRTDLLLLESFCFRFGYENVAFHGVDSEGQQIYHTNVMMSIGKKLAVICMDAITDADEKREVSENLLADGHKVITISHDQMNRFAGNMLEVVSRNGQPLMVMSRQAKNSLNTEQIDQIEAEMPIVSAPLETIEKYGGGSARCMMAELFLQKEEVERSLKYGYSNSTKAPQ